MCMSHLVDFSNIKIYDFKYFATTCSHCFYCHSIKAEKNENKCFEKNKYIFQTLSDFLDEECLEASGDLDADDGVEVTFK